MSQDMSIYTSDYYKRDIDEYWFDKNGLLRPDQLAAICYAYGMPFFGGVFAKREPGLVYSIGCGEGVLERHLENMGCEVIGVDPSCGADELYRGETLIDKYEGGGDTIIFCEAIEHIPADEIERIFSLIPVGARVIITNWPDFHPIHPDGTDKDHITLVDDELYDRLSTSGEIIVRRGSHLVIDVKGEI